MPRSEEEWRGRMTPEQYRVMREQGTEAPFSGKYAYTKDQGVYRCAACGAELFSSEAKFDSGTGWPSFTEPMNPVRNGVSNGVNREHIELREDTSGGMRRVEVLCKRCGSHLGHVFEDGPIDRGGKRYCINSCALDLEKRDNP